MYPKLALIAALAATVLAAPVNVEERQLDAVGGLVGGLTGGLTGGATGTGSAADASSSGAAGGSGGLLEPVVSDVARFSPMSLRKTAPGTY